MRAESRSRACYRPQARDAASVSATQPRPAPVNGERGVPAPQPLDPFDNLREQREKKEQSGFEYDPFSINKNLIG